MERKHRGIFKIFGRDFTFFKRASDFCLKNLIPWVISFFMATLINTLQIGKIEIGQLRTSIALNVNFCMETWLSLSPSERSGALGMLQQILQDMT